RGGVIDLGRARLASRATTVDDFLLPHQARRRREGPWGDADRQGGESAPRQGGADGGSGPPGEEGCRGQARARLEGGGRRRICLRDGGRRGRPRRRLSSLRKSPEERNAAWPKPLNT